MQISLTIVSENYHKLSSTRVQAFDDADLIDLQANVETALGGSASFISNGSFYTVSETLSTITALTGGSGNADAGTPVANVSTVAEYGTGVVHQTVVTVNSVIPVVSVGAAAGQGGLKIYDFPAGRITVLGVMSDLDLAIAAAKQSDFTDATPEGDYSIGTVITTSATLGDATDVDLTPKTAFTMAAYAKTGNKAALASLATFDGTDETGEPKSANINIIVDAGDIDNDVTTEIGVSGTVTISWVNLGNY